MQILIVEADSEISKTLVEQIESYGGISTIVLDNGDEVINTIRKEMPCFVILDILLPGKDGLTVCREIRQFSNVPIIIVSAKNDEIDRLNGLDAGADDYVSKPFFPKEIVARIKAICRRSGMTFGVEKLPLSYRDITVNYLRYRCEINGEMVPLTHTELRLLYMLMENVGIVLSREKLIKSYTIEALENNTSTRPVDNHIKNLRKKLTQASSDAEYIHSIYGVGYKLE